MMSNIDMRYLTNSFKLMQQQIDECKNDFSTDADRIKKKQALDKIGTNTEKNKSKQPYVEIESKKQV